MYDTSATITGSNITRQGKERFWNQVHYFKHRTATDGSTMLYVHEGNDTKQLNLSTFTGSIQTDTRFIIYHSGKKLSDVSSS